MDLIEKELASTQVFNGEFLSVLRDKVELPDGSEVVREYFRHPGATAVLALTDDGQIIMERQYRYPHHCEFLEIPAGKLDDGEVPEICGRLELLEETGYTASEWVFLATACPCISYSDEKIHYFLARGLHRAEQKLDQGEFLEVQILPLQQVMSMARCGDIHDSKTVVGLFWLQAYLQRENDHAPV